VEIYDTEEEQVEALKAWWKENKNSVIIGSILGVILILGWEFWQDQKLKQAEQASALYAELLNFVSQDKQDSAEKISEQLIKQHGSTAYASYTPLMQAKLKVSAGDLPAAKKILEAQLKKGDKALQNVTRIELIRLMLASKEYEKGLQLIAEVDQAATKGFSANYEELTGDLYVALDRLGEARTAYQNAIRQNAAGEGATSPIVQFKLDDIAAPETLQNPAH
jgi:predicted negative regulator of RcsB-dependent stress response